MLLSLQVLVLSLLPRQQGPGNECRLALFMAKELMEVLLHAYACVTDALLF